MAKSRRRSREFTKGDWIVHLHHGVGQIKGVVTKNLNGQKSSYYRVKTQDSTLYVPVGELDDSRLRPLASKSQFGRAVRVLRKPPREMDTDHNDRKKVIRNVKTDGSLLAICRLVRDLSARRAQGKLNSTEERALRRFRLQLLSEWSVCREVSVDEARTQLDHFLSEGRSQADA